MAGDEGCVGKAQTWPLFRTVWTGCMTMDGGLQPLDPAMHLIGQARTVRGMVCDTPAMHAADNLVQPEDVLVPDASGSLGITV